jgi:hypothetical protein
MNNEVRDYWVKLCYDGAKVSYGALFVGALVLYYGKQGQMDLWDTVMLMGWGLILGTSFVYTGYWVLTKEQKEL